MRVVVYNRTVFNVDNDEDTEALLAQGARELTADEIVAAGMVGFEHLVSPLTTSIDDSGTITFTPPSAALTIEANFVTLRHGRDQRLAATDYLLMPDYPIDASTLEAVKTYRQALRDLPSQDGAPWDGGGEATPWPAVPELTGSTKSSESTTNATTTFLPPSS